MLAMAVLSAAVLSRAHADGDPASDVLIGERVFYPYGSNVPPSLQSRLNAETAAASRAHFPIKVALIAAPADLGAVPTLFGKPKQYAAFLVQEISFLNVKPLLLVLMPNGYGGEHLGSAAQAALASFKAPGPGGAESLAQAAIVAVPKLAAAAGHPLGSVAGAGGAGSHAGSSTVKAIVLAMSAIVIAGALVGFRTVRVRRYASQGDERRGHG
jgi:hypothetical protein